MSSLVPLQEMLAHCLAEAYRDLAYVSSGRDDSPPRSRSRAASGAPPSSGVCERICRKGTICRCAGGRKEHSRYLQRPGLRRQIRPGHGHVRLLFDEPPRRATPPRSAERLPPRCWRLIARAAACPAAVPRATRIGVDASFSSGRAPSSDVLVADPGGA